MLKAQPAFDPPTLRTQTHAPSAFNSGEPALDDWLRQRAWPNLQAAASRTYVVCPAGTLKIIGYAALSMGQILARKTTGSMRRNRPKHIPTILLGRLAIDREWQGTGLYAVSLITTLP